MKKIPPLVLLTIFLPVVCFGAEHATIEGDKHAVSSIVPSRIEPSVAESLSPELRQLLSKEMRALQGGMTSIIPAYVSGNWEAIEETAGKMKNSYIFKQHLTKKQAKELHSVLPEAFIEKDKNFHYLAKMLGHAANKKKPELVNFYYSEMLEACVGCHTQFATHKFSNLVIKNNNGHSH